MATVFAPSVILGERPDRDHQSQRRFNPPAVRWSTWRISPRRGGASAQPPDASPDLPGDHPGGRALPAGAPGRRPAPGAPARAGAPGSSCVGSPTVTASASSCSPMPLPCGALQREPGSRRSTRPRPGCPPPSSSGADLFRPATAFAALRTAWPRSAPLPRRIAFPVWEPPPVPRLAGRAPGAARPCPPQRHPGGPCSF